MANVDKALSRILGSAPEPIDGAAWDDAIAQAARLHSRDRSAGGESTAERMKRLRTMLESELVAFHDSLVVKPAEGKPEGGGARRWEVAIPLTLFPLRDQGFTRVECVVEFSANETPQGIRVVDVFPEKRTKVYAEAEMGGTVEVKTKMKMGLPSVALAGLGVATASAEVYGKGKAGPFIYRAERVCVDSEIVGGTRARWRMDDATDAKQVGVESHQLRVTLEVEPHVRRVDAAGYLNAYSETKWLTSTLGSAWRDLKGKVLGFFKRGAPAEAFAEWANILPGDGTR